MGDEAADMRLALATCAELPEWEVDDRPLWAALRARGHEIAHPSWDDAEVEWGDFDAVLIRTTWDYMERREEFLSWAEWVEVRSRLVHPPAIVRWNTDKHYLADLWNDGVPIPPTVFLEARQEVDLGALMRERGWDKGFLKPCVGATSRATHRFLGNREGIRIAQDHLDPLLENEGMILQPYLPSIETEGELSAVFLGGEYSHGVRKIPAAGDYRAQDDWGALDEPWEPTRVERECLLGFYQIAEARCGPLLYARIDCLRDSEGSLLLNELELVEPSLFFRHSASAPRKMAEGLEAWLRTPHCGRRR